MFKVFDQRKSSLGLDISDISLKLVELHVSGGGFAIQAYCDTAVPKEVLSGDAIKDPRLLTRIIKQSLAAPKFGEVTTDHVVASIPETKSFVRVIQMPAVSEEEAREAIPWEAEQYIPIPIGQVYLDWVILDRNSPSSPLTLRGETPSLKVREGRSELSSGKMTVLITASPKDYIDEYVAILKEAGLRPLALEVESQATARSLVWGPYLEQAVLIADINTLRTRLVIFDKGTLEFTSSIPIAGKIFTESIARSMGLEFEEAEALKRKVGLDEEEDVRGAEVKKILTPMLNNLVEEIKNTIRFYEEHTPGGAITRLILSGGSAKLRHLPSFLQEKLKGKGVRVELGNPWSKVLRKGQIPPISREDSLSYATAIGLALREME